jgi:excisionase family DNA binding protein
MKSDMTLAEIVESIAVEVVGRLRSENAGQTSQITPRLLTVEQAAVYLGRSKAAVQHMIQAGTLPVVRDGRRVFLDVHELEKWIAKNSQG